MKLSEYFDLINIDGIIIKLEYLKLQNTKLNNLENDFIDDVKEIGEKYRFFFEGHYLYKNKIVIDLPEINKKRYKIFRQSLILYYHYFGIYNQGHFLINIKNFQHVFKQYFEKQSIFEKYDFYSFLDMKKIFKYIEEDW